MFYNELHDAEQKQLTSVLSSCSLICQPSAPCLARTEGLRASWLVFQIIYTTSPRSMLAADLSGMMGFFLLIVFCLLLSPVLSLQL